MQMHHSPQHSSSCLLGKLPVIVDELLHDAEVPEAWKRILQPHTFVYAMICDVPHCEWGNGMCVACSSISLKGSSKVRTGKCLRYVLIWQLQHVIVVMQAVSLPQTVHIVISVNCFLFLYKCNQNIDVSYCENYRPYYQCIVFRTTSTKGLRLLAQ